MKRTMLVAAVGVGLMVGGCSRSGGSVMAPTATLAPAASSTRMTTKTVASPGLDFSDAYLGMVTITNNDTAAHRFAYYVWDASNEGNQLLKARIEQAIAPGKTATLTLAFEQVCGAKYQRDVYRDIPNYVGATSESETRNYLFGAAGAYWQSEVGRCDTPTVPPVIVPPPPPTCQDHEANNFGGLLPCTFGEGVIVVEDPPVDVIDPPPPSGPSTFLFCHVEYNVGHGRGNEGVITFVHEVQLNIPLLAITNGHSDPAHHSYDYYGTCDGRGIGGQQ